MHIIVSDAAGVERETPFDKCCLDNHRKICLYDALGLQARDAPRNLTDDYSQSNAEVDIRDSTSSLIVFADAGSQTTEDMITRVECTMLMALKAAQESTRATQESMATLVERLERLEAGREDVIAISEHPSPQTLSGPSPDVAMQPAEHVSNILPSAGDASRVSTLEELRQQHYAQRHALKVERRRAHGAT